MGLLDLFRRKESLARTVTTIQQIGKPQSTPANYENFAKVGYGKNVIVHRSVAMIAGAAKGMSFILYDKTNPKKPKEITTHPMLTLWNKPNPMQSTSDFVENMVAFYCLAGNSYIEANHGGARTATPLELWNVRPDRMRIIPGPKGYPAAYQYTSGGQSVQWDVDIVKMRSDIMHWKTFNPLNDWYGMSALEAALMALDQNIAGQTWNLSLLQNAATPSGVLQVNVTDANPGGVLNDEQFKDLQRSIEERYSSAKNAGRPMLLEGGITWQQMSLSPKDVDYTKGKEISATDIAISFGIPPELLGLGNKTFNNYREARLSFYEETVLPIMDSAMGSLNRWLAPIFGENLYLDYDKDDIEVLQWKREQRYTSLQATNFLTQNEKREAVGYEPKEEWDVFVIGNTVGMLPEDFTPAAAPSADPSNPDDTNPNPEDEPKKPAPESEPPPEEPEPEDDGKSWKSINLLNANEKKASWRRQNAKRKELQKAFDRDLLHDLKELSTELEKITGVHTDAKLTEYALLNVLNNFMPTMHKTIKKHIKYALEDFGLAVLGESKTLGLVHDRKANLKFDGFVKSYTERRSGEAIKSITSTSTKKIRSIVGEWVQTAIEDGDTNNDLSKYINAEFEELTPSMATRIARTEVSMASNNGSLEAVKSLQIPNMFKEWVTANDDRVRDGAHGGADHSAMNGAEVGLDEKFGVPPDALMDGPGDGAAGADQVINCRCVLVYKSKDQ